MARRRREVTLRITSHDEGKRHDYAYWRAAGDRARFEAAWELVLEWQRWKGERAFEPRLQRSVLRIERRSS